MCIFSEFRGQCKLQRSPPKSVRTAAKAIYSDDTIETHLVREQSQTICRVELRDRPTV